MFKKQKALGGILEMVRKERLELSRVAPLEPKSSASTSSATFARNEIRQNRHDGALYKTAQYCTRNRIQNTNAQFIPK